MKTSTNTTASTTMTTGIRVWGRVCVLLAALGCGSPDDVADAGGVDAEGADSTTDSNVDSNPSDGSVPEVANDGDANPDATTDATLDTSALADGGEDCPRLYYLDPAGDDDGTGDETAPLLTLAEVHTRLMADPPACDVEVWIEPGVYREQRVEWRFTMPENTITFRASDRLDRPVFDGCAADGRCEGGTFFILRHSAGEETNLHFWYLRVQRYQTAISLNGARDEEATSNGSNRVFGCYFDRIGNIFSSSLEPSTACVRLVNSDDNEISNNHFVDVVNTRSGGLIHSIYVAHMSDRNTITDNRFQRSTGDPIRVRDFSNGNIITDNRFIKVASHAAYSDWYCDHEVRDDCTKPSPECPSWDNQFRDNLLDGNWACESLRTFQYFQDDTTAGCDPPSPDARRLRTSGNTQTATPCSMN